MGHVKAHMLLIKALLAHALNDGDLGMRIGNSGV